MKSATTAFSPIPLAAIKGTDDEGQAIPKSPIAATIPGIDLFLSARSQLLYVKRRRLGSLRRAADAG